jgi:hypothetical protein
LQKYYVAWYRDQPGLVQSLPTSHQPPALKLTFFDQPMLASTSATVICMTVWLRVDLTLNCHSPSTSLGCNNAADNMHGQYADRPDPRPVTPRHPHNRQLPKLTFASVMLASTSWDSQSCAWHCAADRRSTCHSPTSPPTASSSCSPPLLSANGVILAHGERPAMLRHRAPRTLSCATRSSLSAPLFGTRFGLASTCVRCDRGYEEQSTRSRAS